MSIKVGRLHKWWWLPSTLFCYWLLTLSSGFAVGKELHLPGMEKDIILAFKLKISSHNLFFAKTTKKNIFNENCLWIFFNAKFLKLLYGSYNYSMVLMIITVYGFMSISKEANTFSSYLSSLPFSGFLTKQMCSQRSRRGRNSNSTRPNSSDSAEREYLI